MHVREIAPRFAAKEILAHIRDAALDMRLPRWLAHGGRVDHEAPILRILLKSALKDRIVAVRFRDGRRQVVDDEAGGHAAEKLPRVLEPADDVGDPLRVRDVHILVAGANTCPAT